MLLGRAEERARIGRLIAEARLGTSTALVLAGDPGIGKTALLDDAVDGAGDMAVLRVRGVESEAEIPFAGLLALLRPVLGRLDEIPPRQATALRGALALEAAVARDRFAIGAATLSVLAAHAEQQPVLLAIDDAHWLDEPSLAAVVFAARRLLADAVAVLLTVRAADPAARRLHDAGLPRLALGGLDREAATSVLAQHAGRPLPPGTADRLYELTLGNPLALVELAAAPDPEPAGPLAIETSVERAFADRIVRLPDPARRLLALAAAEDSGDLTTLARAATLSGLDVEALDEGERAGLVTRAAGSLAFRHPLMRSAAYRSAAPAERRGAHRALAEAVGEPDRRAWHLAAATAGTDEAAAEALAEAGARARARSAYGTAATAFERAAALTPERTDAARRLLAAAESAWLAGHADRTARLLDAARDGHADAALRTEIDHLRGHAAMRSGPVMDGHDLLVDAAARALAVDRGRAIVMLAEAADACAYAARPEPMLRAAGAAWEALWPQAGERERFFASLALGMALIYNGRGDEGAQRVREAVEILERSDALSGDPRLLSSAALGPLWLREVASSRGLVDRAIASARSEGAVGTLPFSLWLAGRDAATSDRLAVAEALYEEAIRLARETGQATAMCAAVAGLACVEARQGREDACREHVAEALALSDALGLGFFRIWALDALAELELGGGRVEPALRALLEKDDLLAERGIADPDVAAAPELVEALVRVDRADEARSRLDAFAVRAQAKGLPWALARLARCRGLLAGDGDFPDRFDEALRLHERTPDRFEEARTRLCYGERLRRARRRVQARDELRRAIALFDELAAAPWAERARDELLATGETARRRNASTLDQLTPRELQVSLVLAEGHTLREAGAKLFLSPKTVDYHLRSVYRKLGVSSRDALAAALGETGAASTRSPS